MDIAEGIVHDDRSVTEYRMPQTADFRLTVLLLATTLNSRFPHRRKAGQSANES
jgi:hypothetical protein